MNFFFGVKNNILCSEITIPRFQNQSNTQTKYNLYGAFIKSNKWNINLFNNCEINKQDLNTIIFYAIILALIEG
jgi:hypothetical protein